MRAAERRRRGERRHRAIDPNQRSLQRSFAVQVREVLRVDRRTTERPSHRPVFAHVRCRTTRAMPCRCRGSSAKRRKRHARDRRTVLFSASFCSVPVAAARAFDPQKCPSQGRPGGPVERLDRVNPRRRLGKRGFGFPILYPFLTSGRFRQWVLIHSVSTFKDDLR